MILSIMQFAFSIFIKIVMSAASSQRNSVLYVLTWVACQHVMRAGVVGVGGVLTSVKCQCESREWCANMDGMSGMSTWVACQRERCSSVGDVSCMLAWMEYHQGWLEWCAKVSDVLAWVGWVACPHECCANVSDIPTCLTCVASQRW